MDFSIQGGAPEKQKGGCIAIGINESHKLSGAATQLDEACGGKIASILKRGDFEAKVGQTLFLHDLSNIAAERLLLVGCGKERKFDEDKYGQAVRASIKAIATTGAQDLVSYLPEIHVKGRDTAWKIYKAAELAEDGQYRFDELKTKSREKKHRLHKLTLAHFDENELSAGKQAMAIGRAIAEGMALAKDLGNLPGNICTPTYLADQANKLADKYGLTTTILDEKEMEQLGMGALLSVSRGSRQPAKLITIEYQGDKKSETPIALVGKGLTFDAGGISLKPAAAMDEMKYDMCGAASVLGTLKVVAELKLPINVVGIIPSSENLPDGEANKPGDIVTSMSGQTIEVLNTDAEGRLILCDALTYSEKFKPAAVIDIATLTGACVVALGEHASGMLCNTDSLGKELLQAGEYSHDRAWQLPLWDSYQKKLDSNFADIANIGDRGGGTITAACFLSRFTKDFKWAHLDIAGTAWLTGKQKGATGRPVPLLSHFLLSRCGLSPIAS